MDVMGNQIDFDIGGQLIDQLIARDDRCLRTSISLGTGGFRIRFAHTCYTQRGVAFDC
jgi:hypothetical protein